ncbi:MAG TPA: ISAzo13 family transposase [Pseudonocardiaceae bacterium]|jgi:hypothetical protein|nr:ISAzo13 family transposase [Pseudonocardiaceae bacterium]
MRITQETERGLAAKFAVILPHLDERQRRLVLAAEARSLGHGGIGAVARASGAAETTVSRGISELDAGGVPPGRVRRPGGGRKRIVDTDPGILAALLALVEPDQRGDPMSPLRWTTASTRTLADALRAQGWRISADTVADLLRQEGFSLQGNAKVLEGAQHPDRDEQFRYINEQVKAHQDTADPVVSVDTKKKEQVGEFHNPGRQWRPAGQPIPVRSHDFPDTALGMAVPYGIYDMTANTGWVNVGTDHNTAAFAVTSLRRWWDTHGRVTYPHARRLLITADAGGANGYRTHAWKTELAAFAADTGLAVTVCHFPPGTSKWNHIEHRLFAHISMNWRGRPLTSHEVIVNTIAATTTRTGLRVHAELDTNPYATGQKPSKAQLAALPLQRHDWHGDWNYTLHPHPTPPPPPPEPPATQPAHPDLTHLHHPELTGIPTTEWQRLLDRLTVPQQAQREAHLHNKRGRTRKRTGAGQHSPITLADRLLITVLRQRFDMPAEVIADLHGLHYTSIYNYIREMRHLLTQIRYTIPLTDIRLRTLTDLADHATSLDLDTTTKIEPACQ